jgi:putative PIN family toxin of toxin-antitoxin system
VTRAVLDANVYVSAAVRAEGPPGKIIDRFLRGGTFEIVMSQAIVEEVLRALNYPKVRKYIRPGLDPELWFEDIVVLSHLVAGEHEGAGASKDRDDDKYIGAAIEDRAGFVVAGDSDLLDLKEYDGIRIVSPRVFLDLLVVQMSHMAVLATASRPRVPGRRAGRSN